MNKITVRLEDVGGSFARFLKDAKPVAREAVSQAVRTTTFGLAQRMRANAPGPSDRPPYIRDAIEAKLPKRNGLTGQAGIFEGDSGSPGASQADVAMFNEYSPNKQPFMKPAAEATANEFRVAMMRALGQVEQRLSASGRSL